LGVRGGGGGYMSSENYKESGHGLDLDLLIILY
jgi:hypothetical protein